MHALLTSLFSGSGFMPHGHCYLWTPHLIWLHASSDALIVLSYYSIPLTLLYFLRRRSDVDFGWMFACFAAFILACGTTHLLEIWNIWHSLYWLSGLVKAVTALASVATAILLIRLVPAALALPSPGALARANAVLENEVQCRRTAEAQARELNACLETRVAERTAAVVAAHDDLNRQIAGRALVENDAAHFAAIVESSDDAIVGKDLLGIVTSWNTAAERIFGYPASEMIGQSILRIIPPDRRQEETEIITRISSGESVRHFETVRVRKDGKNIDVSVTVSAIRDRSGRIIGASKVARDITDRKMAEETIRRLNTELEHRVVERTAQLQAANRELEAFSYSVSHDLRAPLRAMDGFSQAVLEDFGEHLPEEGRRYLGIIRAAAQKMGLLIDDLLAFSRLSRAELKKQTIDTGALVAGLLDDFAHELQGPRVDLRIGKLQDCHGDPALLRQVFFNLLSNALKYTRKREAALVEIGCEQPPGSPAVYFVRDSGTGFDMRYAGKLFGVFQRLHRAEDYEGTGVGLALVQRIIHRHGGRVWAEAAVDRGATFYFTLAGEPETV